MILNEKIKLLLPRESLFLENNSYSYIKDRLIKGVYYKEGMQQEVLDFIDDHLLPIVAFAKNDSEIIIEHEVNKNSMIAKPNTFIGFFPCEGNTPIGIFSIDSVEISSSLK